MKKNETIDKLKYHAKFLVDTGENVEYTRGICELLAEIDCTPECHSAERAQQIAFELGLNITLYPKDRLEYLRQELRAERISMGELAELQDLAEYIEPGDVELLEAAGVPEFGKDTE